MLFAATSSREKSAVGEAVAMVVREEGLMNDGIERGGDGRRYIYVIISKPGEGSRVRAVPALFCAASHSLPHATNAENRRAAARHRHVKVTCNCLSLQVIRYCPVSCGAGCSVELVLAIHKSSIILYMYQLQTSKNHPIRPSCT